MSNPALLLNVLVTVGLLAVVYGERAYPLEYGINNGAPINARTGAISASNNPTVLAETGARWIRINFILGPWEAPGDPNRHGPENLTWFQTYDKIVNGLVAKNLQVYGAIGGEAVRNSSRDRLNTVDYSKEYATNFAAIVEHFKDRVQVYEGFNEPNDWAGGTTSQVKPYWFARYTEDIYRAVKIDNGHRDDPSWQRVKLVTGPLFTHNDDVGGGYFAETCKEGRTNLGWDVVKQITGSYPFDGVGFHVYVAQGSEPTGEAVLLTKRNLDAMHQSLVDLDGKKTSKKFYISEFGWRSDNPSEKNQADKMDVSWNFFENDSRIAQAHWFTLQDFTDAPYGIYRPGAFSAENRKEAYSVFRSHASQPMASKP